MEIKRVSDYNMKHIRSFGKLMRYNYHNRGTEVLGGNSKTSVKVVTRFLGTKAVFIIVVIMTAQN